MIGSIMQMLEIDLAVPDLSASKARRDDIEPAGVRIADSKLPAIECWRASSHRRQHGPEASRCGRMVV